MDPSHSVFKVPPHRPLQLFIAYRLKPAFQEIEVKELSLCRCANPCALACVEHVGARVWRGYGVDEGWERGYVEVGWVIG